MKMHDVGVPEKEMYGSPIGEKATERRIVRPSLDLTQKQFPPLEGKDFGDRCTIVAEVKIKGVRKNDRRVSYDLEFMEIGLKGDKLSEKEFGKLSKEDQREYMQKSVS